MTSLYTAEATVARWPTAERVRALKRVLPRAKVQAILRRNRINPRVIKRKMSNWKKKRPQPRRYPQPTKKFRQRVILLN